VLHRVVILCLVLALGALSHLSGCVLFTEPRDLSPADDRGAHVASASSVASLTWSTDGTELYFVDAALTLRAVPATGGTARTVYTSSVSLGHVSAVANRVYVSLPTTGGWQIRRVDPANGNATTVVNYTGTVASSLFAVSQNERFVAVGDSLYDVVAGTQQALPDGIPWSFSPDGSQLLFEAQLTAGTTGLRLIATSDAAVATLSSPSDIAARTGETIGAHYWAANDPKFLRIVENLAKTDVQALAHDGRTGTNSHLITIAGISSAWSRKAAVSAGGSRVGIWLGPFDWVQLHVIDAETLRDAVVATVKSSVTVPEVEALVLSPDASRAAYVVYEASAVSATATRVYVVALP
jgi:hypothetical protein